MQKQLSQADSIAQQAARKLPQDFLPIQALSNFDFKNAIRNRQCPHCLKQIADAEGGPVRIVYSKQAKRYYSAHIACSPDGSELSVLSRQQRAEFTVPGEPPSLEEAPQRGWATLELGLCHPLLHSPFSRLVKRTKLYDLEGGQVVAIQLGSNLMYEPNIVALPTDQFRVRLGLQLQEGELDREFLVDLNCRARSEGTYEAVYEGVCLVLELIKSHTSIACLVQSLNYKFPCPDRAVILKRLLFRFQAHLLTTMPRIDPDSAEQPIERRLSIQEDFREVKEAKTQLEWDSIRGQVAVLAKSSVESRQLQLLIKRCDQAQLQLVFTEVKDQLLDLVKDPYANYMVQVLFQSCGEDTVKEAVQVCLPWLLEAVCDKKGTHALQTLVQVTRSEEAWQTIVAAIQHKVVELSASSNGTHFVQKCFLHFSTECLQPFFAQMVASFMQLATNQHGLCALKVMITKFAAREGAEATFLEQAQKHLRNLMLDPYGNYLVQHLYETYEQAKCKRMTELILANLGEYASEQFSSSVVEKCITTFCRNFPREACRAIIERDLFLKLLESRHSAVIQKLLNTEHSQEFMQRLESVLRRPAMEKYRRKLGLQNRQGFLTPTLSVKGSFSEVWKDFQD